MKYKGKFFYLVVVVLACVINACSRQEDKQSIKAERLNVVSTVAPITSIVENIGGDKIGLTGIIPEGINSHTFEPVPSDVKLLAQADLLIGNGLDLEIPTLNLTRANMKKGVALLLLGEKTIGEKEYIYDFSFPKEHGHPNPHLWLNPQHAMRYATLIRDELIRLDFNNKSAYEANAATFLKKLEALDRANLFLVPLDRRRRSVLASVGTIVVIGKEARYVDSDEEETRTALALALDHRVGEVARLEARAGRVVVEEVGVDVERVDRVELGDVHEVDAHQLVARGISMSPEASR
jgi:hypothetical protein